MLQHLVKMTAPAMGENTSPASPSDPSQTVQSGVLRRNRPGTKASAYCQWPEESFENMDSTLAVQQYIQQVRISASLISDVKTLLWQPLCDVVVTHSISEQVGPGFEVWTPFHSSLPYSFFRPFGATFLTSTRFCQRRKPRMRASGNTNTCASSAWSWTDSPWHSRANVNLTLGKAHPLTYRQYSFVFLAWIMSFQGLLQIRLRQMQTQHEVAVVIIPYVYCIVMIDKNYFK